GMGPLVQARLIEPRAIVTAAEPFTAFIAGGSSGTVQAMRADSLETVIGRYPQSTATGMLARFRDETFGTVTGVAYQPPVASAPGVVYLSEWAAARIHAVTVTDPADATTWTIESVVASGVKNPTGLFLDGAMLYVVDTDNHAVRAIDLATATVSTI